MKILIAGCGKVGLTLAQHLSAENHDVTIVDTRDAALKRASDTLDVMCLKGSATSMPVLRQAQADRSDVVIAATGSDEINMLCCHCAKRLGAKYAAARVRNAEYSADMEGLKTELGINLVINPEHAAAVEISRLIRLPSAANIETFRRGEVELVGFPTQEGDFLNGQSLLQLAPVLRPLSILFCAVERGEEFFIPGGNFVIQKGDTVYVMGEPAGISQFFRRLGRGVQKIRSVFIVGGGRIAYYLTRQLKGFGLKVKLVERDEARCRQIAELFPQALVICGDGTDPGLLSAEHLSGSDAFVALTDRDEENLIISLYAMQAGVSKVVAKSNRQNYTSIAHSAGVESVVSPKLTTAGQILRLVRGLQNSKGSAMTALYRIAEGRAEAMEFVVAPSTQHLGIPLKDLRLRKGILIAVIVRGTKVIIPEGSTTLESGDNVIVVARDSGLLDLNDIYADSFGAGG